MPYLHFLALTMGLLVSPDALILLGNQTGRVGLAFLGMILFAGLIALGTAYSTTMLWTQFPGPGWESRGLQMVLGTLPAIVLPLCARLVLLVCASTGILAIAGYVFNEVFVYWFPNLGFSFCLLGLFLMLNLLGPRVAKTAQFFFVMIALSGLLVLSALALLGSAHVPLTPATVRPAPVALILLALGPAVMMYLGMAGEPETEVYARAGLVFWFMYYGAVHLAVLVLVRRAPQPPSRRYATWLPVVSMSVMVLGIVGLLWIDSEAGHLVRFMLMVIASVSGLSLCWMGWRLFKVRMGLSRSGAR